MCILFAKHCVLPFISFNPDKSMKKLIFRLSCKYHNFSKLHSQNLNLACLLLKFMLFTPLHNIKKLLNKQKSVASQCERKNKTDPKVYCFASVSMIMFSVLQGDCTFNSYFIGRHWEWRFDHCRISFWHWFQFVWWSCFSWDFFAFNVRMCFTLCPTILVVAYG